jgi:hypothetical protein
MARPDKIRSVGLKAYLAKTKDKHRGLDYSAFTAMIDGKASISSMARSFNVEWRTMNNWMMIFELEKGEKSERKNSKTIKKSS